MKKLALSTFSAAVLAASAAAAADLGRPAPAAVDYVKVCDAYGEGFFYIPGSETCLRVGGYVRAEYRYFKSDFLFSKFYGNPGTGARTSDRIGTRARANLQFDARTNTEFGLLRSYAEVQYTVDSRTGGSVARTELQKAYIQFGGLTAGRAQSFFDFYTGDHYSSYFETAHSDSIVNLLAYTFSFGNGISATLSLEDSTTGNAGRRFNINAYSAAGTGPLKTPDVVGALKIDQAWGSAQLMAAAHQDYSTINNSEKWGYAVGGGLSVKLPMLGAGDVVNLQAAYTKGAISYATPDPFFATDFTPTGRNGAFQTEAWSVAAGLTHNWNAKWSSALTASYLDVNHIGRFWDYSQFDIGGNLVWAPVAGLTIGTELEYKSVDLDLRGRRDRDALVGLLRVQRNF